MSRTTVIEYTPAGWLAGCPFCTWRSAHRESFGEIADRYLAHLADCAGDE